MAVRSSFTSSGDIPARWSMRALSGTALTRTHLGAVGSLALALSGGPAQSCAVETDRSLHRFIVGARGITTE